MSAASLPADRRWTCPNCGRRYRLAANAPIPALCADCRRRHELGIGSDEMDTAEIPAAAHETAAPLIAKRRNKGWSAAVSVERAISRFVAANPHVLQLAIALMVALLAMLWFNTTARVLRIGAVGLIGAVIWGLYLLAAARWPARSLAAKIVAILAAPLVMYSYFTTARAVYQFQSPNGRLTYRETRTWVGLPLYRTLNGEGFQSQGPLNAGGELHGEWTTWPSPPNRGKVWYWNGEEISEDEWQRRNR